MESISKETCHSREQTCNVLTTYQKIDKVQKLWDCQVTKHREKRQPKIINLSKRHLTKFQVSLLNKKPESCPTTKGNVFEIKSDIKEFTRNLKLGERLWGIEYNDESFVKRKC